MGAYTPSFSAIARDSATMVASALPVWANCMVCLMFSP